MENILDEAKKRADEAELFVVTSDETLVHFEANRLKHIQSKQSTRVALRIIRNGRIGYATATDLGDSLDLINNAVETAQFGMVAKFDFPPLTAYPVIATFDPAIETVPGDKMVALGEELIARVRAHTPDIMCEAWATKGTVTLRIMNSRGGQADFKQSIFGVGIEGQLIHNTDMLFVGESQNSCQPLLDSGPVSNVVLQQLELAKNQASVPTGQMPVIFTPDGVASAFAMPLIAAFNGKTVLQGASPVGDKIGKPVFDKKFSLSDDPTISYRPSSHRCDDEGMPAQHTPLITQGTVKGFLYDLQTAALAHTSSTGNGMRHHGGLPTPSPSALIIAPGSTAFNEMLRDIKEGLVVEQLMGADQGNVLGGDFSGNVLLGYKVENGKIVGRVKNTMVSGNIYRLLKQIAAVGSEAKWVGGSLNTPHLYFANVSVASK